MKSENVKIERREKIKQRRDGSVEISFNITKEEAAIMSEACNLFSEELGRPITQIEAIAIMLQRSLEELGLIEGNPLDKMIDSKYGDKCLPLEEVITADYEDFIFEMFQVKSIHEDHVVLSHFFNDEVFSPVIFDKEVHPLLGEQNLFLMQLGLKDGYWHVVYMSPRYS